MSNDEVKAMVEDFKNQTLPQTATWSLSLWEQSMGLPVNESESVEQRRQNIIEKRRRRNAMNPASTGSINTNDVPPPICINAAASVPC